MTSRHGSSRNDDYRGSSSSAHPPSKGSSRDSRDAVREKRPREENTRRIPIVDEAMDVDMDDDSDDYDRRRGGSRRTATYSSSTRTATIPATASRHGGRDRSPDEPPRTIVNAVPERDQPRVRPSAERDFWIPEAGIEREVIQYEITRYLGQDALVRPGENAEGRRGYLISAYRAPTTEMIKSMKEASEKFAREKQSSRTRPAEYKVSRTATGRDRDIGQYGEKEQQPRRRRDYDSDESMDEAPAPRGYDRDYDRDYDRREPDPRRGERHARDQRDIDPRQLSDPRDPRDSRDPRDPRDPRYQDPRAADPRIQDPRYQPDPRLIPDPRLQDPRVVQDPRYPDPRDPRYQDPRGMPVNPSRHQVYTTGYPETSIPGYTLSPSTQPPGYDYSLAEPRSGFTNNTPPPTSRGGQPIYVQPGYAPVGQGAQMMLDPRTGRQVLVQAGGYIQEPRQGGGRHQR